MVLASASECPRLDHLVVEAWALYNDAEIEAAEKKIEEAREQRGCQRVLVKHETLLELHFLDALLAITLEDAEAAQAAMIRAVAVEPRIPQLPIVGVLSVLKNRIRVLEDRPGGRIPALALPDREARLGNHAATLWASPGGKHKNSVLCPS